MQSIQKVSEKEEDYKFNSVLRIYFEHSDGEISLFQSIHVPSSSISLFSFENYVYHNLYVQYTIVYNTHVLILLSYREKSLVHCTNSLIGNLYTLYLIFTKVNLKIKKSLFVQLNLFWHIFSGIPKQNSLFFLAFQSEIVYFFCYSKMKQFIFSAILK